MPFFMSDGFQADTEFRFFFRRKPYPAFLIRNIFMDPFIITVEPSGETDHVLAAHEGEEWLYGMEGCIEIQYGRDLYVQIGRAHV